MSDKDLSKEDIEKWIEIRREAFEELLKKQFSYKSLGLVWKEDAIRRKPPPWWEAYGIYKKRKKK